MGNFWLPSRRVCLEDVFESCSGHCRSRSVHEQFGHRRRSSNRHPGSEIGRSFFQKRKAPFPPAFTDDSNTWCSFEAHILQRESYQLRDAQSSGETKMHHGSITDSEAGRGIWRVEDSTNPFNREMSHQPLVMPLTRDGMDLLRLCQRGGHAKFDISDERFERSSIHWSY